MIISGRKLLRPSTPSTATKSRNPPDDSPSHPEARRLHPVGALARSHWKEVAPSAIDVRLPRQRRNPPDDSPSHPEARRLLSGELPSGIPKSPIRRTPSTRLRRLRSISALRRLLAADCAPARTPDNSLVPIARSRPPAYSADCLHTRLPGSQPKHQ